MSEFEDKVTGVCRTWALRYDLAGWHAERVLIGSEKYSSEHPAPDFEDLVGRPRLPLDPRDEDRDDDELDEAEEADRLEDARETAEVMEAAGMVKRGRYTPEQMASMHRGEPVR